MKYLFLIPFISFAITKLPASNEPTFMFSNDPTKWVKMSGLYIEGPSGKAIHHLQLGKYCSTVNIDTEKVIENWHLCAK